MGGLVTKKVEFNGSELLAIQERSSSKIFAGINFVLRGIGFDERQIEYRRGKWAADKVVSKGIQKFSYPSENGGIQETYCIDIIKLPLALAKLEITPKMEKELPELSVKLEQYQDRCADVLAEAFFVPEKPKTQAELILAQAQQLVEQEHRLIVLEESSSKQEDKLKELESRITTHPVDYYTIAGYANLKGVRLDVTRANLLGHKAAQMSREYEYDIGKTPDARFGTVNTYHIDILETVLET